MEQCSNEHARGAQASPNRGRPRNGAACEVGRKRLHTFSMLIIHVHVRVKPESIEAFKAATLANARASLREAGIARFDVCQQADDPASFVLVEAYRSAEAPAAHKQTAHYAAWRDAIAPMMAVPRASFKFASVFPDETGW